MAAMGAGAGIATPCANVGLPVIPAQNPTGGNRPTPAVQRRLNVRPLSGSRIPAANGGLWVVRSPS